MSKLRYNYNNTAFSRRNNILKNSDFGFESYSEFLNSYVWKSIKETAINTGRFNNCFGCGKSKDVENLEFHHMKYKKDITSLSSIKHLRVLCRTCHQDVHNISRDMNISFKVAERLVRRKNGYKMQ